LQPTSAVGISRTSSQLQFILLSPKLHQGSKMLKVTLADVPNHLRSGERYKAMLIDPVGGFDVPCHCFKTDLSVSNVDAAICLLSTLQHWKVNDLVPVNLVEWICHHPDQVLQSTAVQSLSVGVIWLESLLGIVGKATKHDCFRAPITKPDGAHTAASSGLANADKLHTQCDTVKPLLHATPVDSVQQSAAVASGTQLAGPVVSVSPNPTTTASSADVFWR
jgi:hypothetical protein